MNENSVHAVIAVLNSVLESYNSKHFQPFEDDIRFEFNTTIRFALNILYAMLETGPISDDDLQHLLNSIDGNTVREVQGNG